MRVSLNNEQKSIDNVYLSPVEEYNVLTEDYQNQ